VDKLFDMDAVSRLAEIAYTEWERLHKSESPNSPATIANNRHSRIGNALATYGPIIDDVEMYDGDTQFLPLEGCIHPFLVPDAKPEEILLVSDTGAHRGEPAILYTYCGNSGVVGCLHNLQNQHQTAFILVGVLEGFDQYALLLAQVITTIRVGPINFRSVSLYPKDRWNMRDIESMVSCELLMMGQSDRFLTDIDDVAALYRFAGTGWHHNEDE
jgi:hypothetical protein